MTESNATATRLSLKAKVAINNLLSRGLLELNEFGKMRYVTGWDDARVREQIAVQSKLDAIDEKINRIESQWK